MGNARIIFTLALLAQLVSAIKAAKKGGDDEGCDPEQSCCPVDGANGPNFAWSALGVGVGIWCVLFVISYYILCKISGWEESKLWRLVFCRREGPKGDDKLYPLGSIAAAFGLIVCVTIHGAVYGTYFYEQNVVVGGTWSDLILLIYACLFILRAITKLPSQGWFDFIFELSIVGVAMVVCAAIFIDMSHAGWTIGTYQPDSNFEAPADDPQASAPMVFTEPSTISARSALIFNPAPTPTNGTAPIEPGLKVVCQIGITNCGTVGNTDRACNSCLVYDIAPTPGVCEEQDSWQGMCFAVSASCEDARGVLAGDMIASCIFHIMSYTLLMLCTAMFKIEQDIYLRKKPCCFGVCDRPSRGEDEEVPMTKL